MKTNFSEERRLACEAIRKAFAGVRLEEGVGLSEARGLDDYADVHTLKAYRKNDEKHDWAAIPTEQLDKYHDTLSFFDAKGMRFHLPAFMITELQGEGETSAIYTVGHISEWSKTKFVNFSQEQRLAARAYLLALKDEDDYEWHRPKIEAALAEYWVEGKE